MSWLLALLLAVSGSGWATYYDDGPGLYAAVPSYSFGDPTYRVTVCRQDAPSTCVTVTVRDHCNCYVGTSDERLIDLSPEAFRALEPRIFTSRDPGKIRVFVQSVGGAPTPPPTDTLVATGGYAPRVFAL